jgi:putative endonuclease
VPAVLRQRRARRSAKNPKNMRQYYIYIMSSKSRTLYTGVTNDLRRRVYEHKHKLTSGFTAKYNITQLVYYEATSDIRSAITREKQIKGWLRAKKVASVESINPGWQDLSADWRESDQAP